jgi:hypothetical protein
MKLWNKKSEKTSRMKIRILYFDGCPSYEPVAATVREVLTEQNLDAEIELVRVESREQELRIGSLGRQQCR